MRTRPMENLDKILDEIPTGQLLELALEAVFGELLGELEEEGEEEALAKAKKQRKKTAEGGEREKLGRGADSSTKQLAVDADKSSESSETGSKRRRSGSSSTKPLAISLGSSTELVEGERRKRRRSGSSSTKPLTLSLGSSAEWVEGERRRRRRSGDSSSLEARRRIKPKPIPHPIPDKQAEINNLAQEIAARAAEKYILCIPPEIKSALTDGQIKFQQKELSVGIADTLKSQLSWALTNAWLEAKNSNTSR